MTNTEFISDSDIDTAYTTFANAIIIQAVKDYRKAEKKNDSGAEKEIKDFFFSEWFTVLTKIDPKRLIRKLSEIKN